MTAHRILQTLTTLILALGIWRHDLRTIVASILLMAMWWLLHEEVGRV